MLTDKVKFNIEKHSEESENECCGYIYFKDGNYHIEKKENLNPSPSSFFMEPPSNAYTVAYYHSHDSSSDFSEEDKMVSESTKLPAVLFNKGNRSFNLYAPHLSRIPYEGRPFLLGYSDCLTLIKDYYSNQLNIGFKSEANYANHLGLDIKDTKKCIKARYTSGFNQSLREILGEKDWLKNYLEYNNFYQVSEFKEKDVLLIASENESYSTHCILYLGKNRILHHPVNRKSKIETISDFYLKRTLFIMRHELL